jgi:ATP-binding cassette subfamily F protein 3
LGANGNGKSTLARIIAGRLKPEVGTRRAHRKLKVGFFAQHQMVELTPGMNAIQHLALKMQDQPEQKVRTRLGGFGFSSDKALTAVEKLSGGEKSRLLLALASFDAPNILILDEPTNHLDVDAREALIQAVNSYDGAVLLISHDRHLIETCADRLWLVEDGTVAPYDGDVGYYRKASLAARGAARANNNGDDAEARPAETHHRNSRKAARKAGAEARATMSAVKKAARTAEKAVEKATAERAELEEALADPTLYEEGATDLLNGLLMRKGRIDKRLAEAEATWLAAEAEMEKAGD